MLLSAMERAGIPAQLLLAGLPTSLDELRTPGQRIDWEVWAALTERLEGALGGPDALEEFMIDAAANVGGLHQFQRVAQLLSSPIALYRLNSQWGVPNQYRNMRSSCETLAGGRLSITMTLADGYRGSRAVFTSAVGILRGMPALIGLGQATVLEREVGERGARLVIQPPTSRTVFSQLKRVGRRVGGLASMLSQLGEQELELDEKRAALESSEARWQALAENAPGVILIVTHEGHVRSASRRFCGLSPEALRDRRLPEMVTPATRAGLETALHRLGLDSGPSEVEIAVLEAEDGRETRYSCRMGAMKQGDGAICAFLTDVTERRRVEGDLKEREAELERAQRLEALGRLAGGVAHDFNNLLTVICGSTDLLLSERWLSAEQREELVQIQLAGERAVGLTRQLLAFSRQQVIVPEVLDPEDLVEGARGMLERLLGEDIHIDFQRRGLALRAKLDRSQFEQILMNLAVNARDAMPRGGTLSIAVGPRTLVEPAEFVGGGQVVPGDYVELTIRDSGLGIAPEAARRMFEPFYTTKPRGGGTGLGLAIVRGIVTQSQGYVAVESELGRGTTFHLLFPETKDAAEPTGATPARAPGGTERILLVEDDALVRTLVHRILSDRGYVVTICERGAEALDFAQRTDFDLLLTDVVMPEINGPELAKLVTAISPDLKVLFMSGYAEHEIVNRGVVNPGVALLPKPFTPEALAHAVRKRLDDPAAARLKSG